MKILVIVIALVGLAALATSASAQDKKPPTREEALKSIVGSSRQTAEEQWAQWYAQAQALTVENERLKAELDKLKPKDAPAKDAK